MAPYPAWQKPPKAFRAIAVGESTDAPIAATAHETDSGAQQYMVSAMSKPVRIAIFLMTSNNDYQTIEKDGCRAAARRHHFSVRELSARNDPDRQFTQIKECLAEPEAIRPRALIVFPVIESLLRPVAEEAARLGVAFVLLNRSCAFMEELRGRYPTVPMFSVMPDQEDIGRIQGRQFAKLLPSGGELLYIQGTFHTSAARLRLAGVRQSLAGLNIRTVMEQGDWSNASGSAAVQRWLRARVATTSVSCVVGAQNDDMAMGARTTLIESAVELKQPELRDIPVTGCDGTPAQGQVWVRDKELRATVIMPATAARAVDVLAEAFESGKAPSAPERLLLPTSRWTIRLARSQTWSSSGLPTPPSRPRESSMRGPDRWPRADDAALSRCRGRPSRHHPRRPLTRNVPGSEPMPPPVPVVRVRPPRPPTSGRGVAPGSSSPLEPRRTDGPR